LADLKPCIFVLGVKPLDASFRTIIGAQSLLLRAKKPIFRNQALAPTRAAAAAGNQKAARDYNAKLDALS
jgi:hypothetical protein